jgi:hypothetical protein
MGYNMKRGAAPKFRDLGSSPTKIHVKGHEEEKGDVHAGSEPSIEEQLEYRKTTKHKGKSLKEQCIADGGTWDAKTGTCKFK